MQVDRRTGSLLGGQGKHSHGVVIPTWASLGIIARLLWLEVGKSILGGSKKQK